FSTGRVPVHCCPGRLLPSVQEQRTKAILLYSLRSNHFEGKKRSNRARVAQQPNRKKEQRAEETEHAANGNSHNAKRQRQQPNDRIKHQCQQRNRPTQHEQNAPQKESRHGNLASNLHSNRSTTKTAEKFPRRYTRSIAAALQLTRGLPHPAAC